MERIIRNGFHWNGIYQRFKIHSIAGNYGLFRLFVGNKGNVILIGQILINAIGYKNILKAIIVHVYKQGTPTPVGGFYPCQTAYVTEGAIAVVDLQHVAGELVPISGFYI